MHRLLPFAAALLTSLLLAAPVAGAKPEHSRTDVSSPAYEAEIETLALAVCGFPIDFEATGHIITTVFSNPNSPIVQIDRYRLSETFSANGKTLVVHVDAGPDIAFLDDEGNLLVALTGRSITGSGVIGRTVVNTTTGEVVFQAGREMGDFIETLCTTLAP
jgi:hypothetical protein